MEVERLSGGYEALSTLDDDVTAIGDVTGIGAGDHGTLSALGVAVGTRGPGQMSLETLVHVVEAPRSQDGIVARQNETYTLQ